MATDAAIADEFGPIVFEITDTISRARSGLFELLGPEKYRARMFVWRLGLKQLMRDRATNNAVLAALVWLDREPDPASQLFILAAAADISEGWKPCEFRSN